MRLVCSRIAGRLAVLVKPQARKRPRTQTHHFTSIGSGVCASSVFEASPPDRSLNTRHRRGRTLDARSVMRREQIALGKELQALGSEKKWRQVLSTLSSATCPLDTINGNIAITALGRCGRSREAVALLERMRRLGIANTVSYNACIDACRFDQQEALRLFEEAQQSNLKLDLVTFTSTIVTCAKAGDWDKAMQLLGQMRRNNLEPDVYVYNAILDAAADLGQFERTISLMADMREHGLQPSIMSHNIHLKSLSRGGDWKRAVKVQSQMKQDGLLPDVVSYGIAIGSCAKSHQWRQALNLLDEMLVMKLEPSTITYSSIIDVLSKSGKWEAALHVLEQMRESGVKPENRQYNSALDACTRVGKFSEALALLESMRVQGVQDIVSYNTLLNSFAKSGEWERAERLFVSMKQKKIVHDVVTCNIVLNILCQEGQWERALTMLHKMIDGIHVREDNIVYADEVSYGTVINALCKVGKVQEAIHLLRDTSQKQGVRVNLNIWHNVITACTTSSDWKAAVEVLGYIRDAGLQPTRVTYELVIDVCRKCGEHQQAESLTREKEQSVIGFRSRSTMQRSGPILSIRDTVLPVEIASTPLSI